MWFHLHDWRCVCFIPTLSLIFETGRYSLRLGGRLRFNNSDVSVQRRPPERDAVPEVGPSHPSAAGGSRSLSPSVKLKVWFQFYCENNLCNSSFCFVNTFVFLIASCYVCTLICAMWATNRVNQTSWKKKKDALSWAEATTGGAVAMAIHHTQLNPRDSMARCGWWDHFSWIHVWTEGFHLQLWFVNALLFFTISSGVTREVSRVCKSKGGSVWRLLWLTVPVSKCQTDLVGKIDCRSSKWSDALVVSQEEWSGSQTDDISHSTPLSPGLVAVGQHGFLQARFPCDWTSFVLRSLAVGACWPLGASGGSSGILDRFINVENWFLCMFLLSLCVTPRASVHSVLYVNCILPNYLFTEVSFFLIETYLKKSIYP